MSAQTPVNPFPPQHVGLCAVRAEPYPFKDTWPEAPFGDRWRRIKDRLRADAAVAPSSTGGDRHA